MQRMCVFQRSRFSRRLACCAVIILLFFSFSLHAEPLRLISWNVESGDADPEVLATFLSSQEDIDIWALSEVQGQDWAVRFEGAVEEEGSDFAFEIGTTGGADRLLILYNKDRFESLGAEELDNINIGGRVRAPLVLHLRETATGTEFLIMVNHLYRSRAERRHEQSILLNQWARNQSMPIIAAGDYNFDWAVIGGDTDHDIGYNHLVDDGVFVWARPDHLLRTQCSNYDSVLDFVFLAGPATEWSTTSKILESQSDYCPDNSIRSDHRPILAEINMTPDSTLTAPITPTLRTLLLQQLEVIDQSLKETRTLIESLPQ